MRAKTKHVLIRIKEATLDPAISNLSEIKACGEPNVF